MLSNNRITFIAESRSGDIWCQTYDGHIFLFDTKEEKFIDILNPIEEETRHINIVDQTYVLPKGVVWVACDKGYNFRIDEKLCKERKGITLYNSFNQTLKGDQIFSVYQDSEGDEWILTDKGVTVIGQKKADSDFHFYHIKEMKGKIFLASTSGKLAIYDMQTEKIRFAEIPYDIQVINGIHNIGNNDLALATDKGIVIFNVEQKSFKQIDIRTVTQTLSLIHI